MTEYPNMPPLPFEIYPDAFDRKDGPRSGTVVQVVLFM
jgi:hypothetical protein